VRRPAENGLPPGRAGANVKGMPVPQSSPYDHPRLFADERTRLLELVGGLRRADWAQPTPCPGWNVADLVLHLLGDDVFRISRARDGHVGLVPPLDDDPLAFADWLDGVQVTWVEAARRISPALAIELLAFTGPLVHATLAAEAPEAPTGDVWWAGDAAVPAWLDHARDVSEYWIHRQQLLEALGREPDLAVPATAAVLDALRWAYPHRLRRVAAAPGDTAVISVSGPVTVRWTLTFDGRDWLFEPEAGAPAARSGRAGRLVAALDLGTDEAWRLLTNNLPSGAEAGLAFRGEERVVAALLDTRAVIGRPVHR
jgi:uncharacterized protein (TIGR03083 family)